MTSRQLHHLTQTTLLVAFLIGSIGRLPAQETGQAEFKTCYARWNSREIILGNDRFERSWRITNGLLLATSFHDKQSGVEWLAQPAAQPAPCPAASLLKETRTVSITAKSGRFNSVEAESLWVKIHAQGPVSIEQRLQIFPASSGVGITFQTIGQSAPTSNLGSGETAPTEATGIEASPSEKEIASSGDALENLELAPLHLRFTQVRLMDQTDNHNELAFETEWLLMPNEAPFQLQGNVFYLENALNGTGLIFLKQAPLPHARPLKNAADAIVTPARRQIRFSGQGYPFVLLAYSGGAFGRVTAIQNWQRQLRAYVPERDGLFLSNTWGDRSRDARINADFILKEVAAGARLGVDVVQVDDGWQKGRTSNSARAAGKGVWSGYWAADPNFWQPDPVRFPNGLSPVVRAAQTNGIQFGLWFGPDSSQQVANWQRDADRLLELHQKDGINYFKIDSIKAFTPLAEQNLGRFLDQVLAGSDGKIVFDLDVTAEIRPGYFGQPQVGPIFVENRYTDFHRYWPHQTLRNLWKLAHYVDPLRLRMEVLNNRRNGDKYPQDPLAPAAYRADTLFAIAMCANPLGWFEVSNLPQGYREEITPLVAAWKRERTRMYADTLFPIGAAPDGVAWTGFASVATDRQSGYLLLFRENNAEADWQTDLPFFTNSSYQLTSLAGEGTVQLEKGKLTAHIPAPLRYLWLRVEKLP